MITKVINITTPFYRGFGVEVDTLLIAFIYSNAFKSISSLGVDQAKETRRDVKNIFTDYAIVAGDLNSTPRALQVELQMQQLKREMYDFPTYLFPAETVNSSLHIPCFDNYVWDKSRSDIVSAQPLIMLPSEVSQNPRKLIKENGYQSDHVPVSASIRHGGALLKTVIYNVADPTLWYQYYPTAGIGFELDLTSEANRQASLFTFIKQLVAENDFVFLQEVPAALALLLKKTYSYAHTTDMQSAVELESVSKLVLIVQE